MKAIILAGGKGRRLALYTKVLPKPLVPLGEKPILDLIIRQLAHYGFGDIVLSVGYLAELIEAYFQNTDAQLPGVNITYFEEKEPLGTSGPLGMIPGLEETFLVINGDILTTVDYTKLLAYHKEKGGILTIAMHEKEVMVNLGVIEAGEDNVLTGYLEKPKKRYKSSMGIYIYEPAALKYIIPNQYLDFPDLILRLIDKGEKVVGYPGGGYWMDIGRPEDYAQAQEEFAQMKDKLLPWEKEA